LIENKENIAQEMVRWLPHDKTYCYALNVYALSKEVITPEQSILIKQELDAYYGEEVRETSKSKIMIKVFEDLGFSKTKLLWTIIDYFPKHGDLTTFEVPLNTNKLQSLSGILPKDYFPYLLTLQEKGYITKIKGTKYRINFEKIKEVGEYEYKGDTL